MAPAENVVALDPQARPAFAVAMDSPALEVLQVLSDPRVPPASPANPAPRETKDSKDPRVAPEFKVSGSGRKMGISNDLLYTLPHNNHNHFH